MINFGAAQSFRALHRGAARRNAGETVSSRFIRHISKYAHVFS
jgi:hypothetical protein